MLILSPQDRVPTSVSCPPISTGDTGSIDIRTPEEIHSPGSCPCLGLVVVSPRIEVHSLLLSTIDAYDDLVLVGSTLSVEALQPTLMSLCQAVIVDARPAGGRFRNLRALRKQNPSLPIIAILEHVTDRSQRGARKAGATFVAELHPPADLAAIVRKAGSGMAEPVQPKRRGRRRRDRSSLSDDERATHQLRSKGLTQGAVADKQYLSLSAVKKRLKAQPTHPTHGRRPPGLLMPTESRTADPG